MRSQVLRRLFASSATFNGKHPPGFYLVNLLSSKEQRNPLESSIKFGRSLEALSSKSNAPEKRTEVSQPEFVLSEEDNLETKQYFQRLQTPASETVDSSSPDTSNYEKENKNAKLNCEYFVEYGEKGHSVASFQRNKNLPLFLWPLLRKIESEVEPVRLLRENRMKSKDKKNAEQNEVDLEAQENDELVWKFALNTYKVTKQKDGSSQVAGFPYHVDIPTLGDITMVLVLKQPATLELKQKDDNEEQKVVSVDLEPGSLAVFSGPSRSEWMQRILPTSANVSSGEDFFRVSLVFGCK